MSECSCVCVCVCARAGGPVFRRSVGRVCMCGCGGAQLFMSFLKHTDAACATGSVTDRDSEQLAYLCWR